MVGDVAMEDADGDVPKEADVAAQGFSPDEFPALEEEGEEPADADVLSEAAVNKEVNSLISSEAAVSVSKIQQLRFQPVHKSRMCIPLCRMVGLPVVRPAMKSDIARLQDHFRDVGYVEGQGVFYVAIENDNKEPGKVKTVDVTAEMVASWSPNWVKVNAEFEDFLQADPDLQKFSDKMFHVWDGNHRLEAWYPYINAEKSHDPVWHFRVDCILLDLKGDNMTALTALHEINW